MAQYALYLRKSRADLDAEAHGEGETLLRHEKFLLAYAQNHQLNVTQIYREIVSGETIAARPVIQQLLAEVEQGLWTGVLVMEIERLARGETLDQGFVAQAFKYSNTKIITPIKTYDPSNEFDEEYFEFNLFMSRREYKTINRRIQRGRITSAKEGKFLSSVAPYGYNKVKINNDKGYKLEVNSEQSEVIRLIFDWYTKGFLHDDGTYKKLGATMIANKLNELGYKPMVNDSWSKASIIDILKNPVYMGKIRWSYRKEKKIIKNNEIIKTRPDPKDNDYILVDGLHEAIIDIDAFNKANIIRQNRGHAPVPGSDILKNPLTGLVYCSKCGALMTRLGKNSKTPYDTMKCPNNKCDNISAPLYLIERVIIAALNEWLRNYKVIWKSANVKEPLSAAIDDKMTALKQLNSRLDILNQQQDKIYTLLEQGVYSIDTFTERNKKISIEKDDILNRTELLNNEIQKQQIFMNNSDVFIPMAEHILSSYYDLDTAESKNAALKELLIKAVYLKTEHNKRGNLDNVNFSIDIFPSTIKF